VSDRSAKRSEDGPPPTRRGYELALVVSALQKAIRRGQEADAVFWVLEMDASGFTAYAWRRLAIVASEDVGLADPEAVLLVRALRDNWIDAKAYDKRATGGLFLVHATLTLSRARKSRIADNALVAIQADRERREIPDVALDVHTKAGRAMGRGWRHFIDESGLVAAVETGELGYGCLPDVYRGEAEAVLLSWDQRRPQKMTIEGSDGD
jgi:replication-associated recombination protein RarA